MAYYLDPSFHGGPGQIYFDINISMPIDEVKTGAPVPKEAIQLPIRIKTRQNRVPDLMFFTAFCCGVSRAALALLKDFAPKDVATIPIAIVDAEGVEVPGEYFYLNVLAFRNSIVLDETNSKTREFQMPQLQGPSRPVKQLSVNHKKLKVKKLEIQGAHIWHERFIGYSLSAQYELFASDALVQAARRRNLSGFSRAIPIAEI